jgi:hypothetical protein
LSEILALGTTAPQALMKTPENLASVRGPQRNGEQERKHQGRRPVGQLRCRLYHAYVLLANFEISWRDKFRDAAMNAEDV